MRRRVRFALRVCAYVVIAALIAPAVTAVIRQITGWTAMSSEIVQAIAQIPLGLGKFLLDCFAVVLLFRPLLRRR